MHCDPRRIAHDFEKQSSKHRAKIAPQSIPYPEEGLDEEKEGENGEVESIAGEGWIIVNLSELERASVQSA